MVTPPVLTHPIQRGEHGLWFVWSLAVEHTINGEARAAGLETFDSRAAAKAECARRNLAILDARGQADQMMTSGQETYREFYTRQSEHA